VIVAEIPPGHYRTNAWSTVYRPKNRTTFARFRRSIWLQTNLFPSQIQSTDVAVGGSSAQYTPDV